MTQAKPARHPRSRLFAPLGLALIALVLWTVWWLYLARQLETRLDAQAEALRGAGWQVAYADLGVTGWPFRARAEAHHVALDAPSGHGVAAPRLVAEAMAFNPDRWVLLAPEGLVLTRGEDKGKVAVQAGAIRASASGLRNPYPNLALELAEPTFTALPGSDLFPLRRAERIEFYLRPHASVGREGGRAVAAPVTEPQDAADILVRLIGAEGRDGGPVDGLAQRETLTVEVEAVVENARRMSGSDAAGMFAAWARSGGALTDVRGEVIAGSSRAELTSARLAADADGRLAGSLDLTADRPDAAIGGLTGLPATPSGPAGAPRENVPLTVEFRDGRAYLGPFTLAPSPKLF